MVNQFNKLALALSLMFSPAAFAEDPISLPKEKSDKPARTIFKNVNVFNGTDNKLIKGCNIIVEKNKIKDACTKTVTSAEGDTVIDGKGRTLMPGLSDAHVHLILL